RILAKDFTHSSGVSRRHIAAGCATASKDDCAHGRVVVATHPFASALAVADGSATITGHRERRHRASRPQGGADHTCAETVETPYDWVGNRSNSNSHLNGLGRRVPLVKGKQEVDRSEHEHK